MGEGRNWVGGEGNAREKALPKGKERSKVRPEGGAYRRRFKILRIDGLLFGRKKKGESILDGRGRKREL